VVEKSTKCEFFMIIIVCFHDEKLTFFPIFMMKKLQNVDFMMKGLQIALKMSIFYRKNRL
jgi:hypothetical protein